MSYVASLPNFASNHNEAAVVLVCYYRETANLAALFLLCNFCFTKAIKVGHNALRGNFQLD